FPEPDLLPFRIDAETIKKISLEIGELPDARKNRFQQNYGLSLYDSEVLTAEKPISDYFEKAVSCYHKPKQIANLIQTELLGLLKENHVRITECRVKPEFLASIVKMIDNKEISSTVGKIVLRETFVSGTDPEIIVREKNLIQITDTEEIGSIIQEILNEHPQAINDYRAGKVQALGFLVGQVMKKSKNKANPGVVKQILEKKLTDRSNNTEEK
ncbi:MAG TPA: Asp-tRNA(Asn)/Glu-tRNA(Gln) amidotransferase GatCAB subunit B, partial [bacterium]|nr:Asp-tRNA(Asn)/Glu-tRNA(Gln) amidotransferase GatCAB subunit B [bacterium]